MEAVYIIGASFLASAFGSAVGVGIAYGILKAEVGHLKAENAAQWEELKTKQDITVCIERHKPLNGHLAREAKP